MSKASESRGQLSTPGVLLAMPIVGVIIYVIAQNMAAQYGDAVGVSHHLVFPGPLMIGTGVVLLWIGFILMVHLTQSDPA